MYWRFALFMAVITAFPGSVKAQSCQLCAPEAKAQTQSLAEAKPRRALQIEVEASLDFSRVAQTGTDGNIGLDAETGTRRVTGGLADLGGMAVRGSVLLIGEPFSPVLISLPNRVTLRSSTGGSADVVDLSTNVRGVPVLDANGQLRFSFGGRLIVKDRVSGTLRGSIPISADYP